VAARETTRGETTRTKVPWRECTAQTHASTTAHARERGCLCTLLDMALLRVTAPAAAVAAALAASSPAGAQRAFARAAAAAASPVAARERCAAAGVSHAGVGQPARAFHAPHQGGGGGAYFGGSGVLHGHPGGWAMSPPTPANVFGMHATTILSVRKGGKVVRARSAATRALARRGQKTGMPAAGTWAGSSGPVTRRHVTAS
jgi:hypothetical protein